MIKGCEGDRGWRSGKTCSPTDMLAGPFDPRILQQIEASKGRRGKGFWDEVDTELQMDKDES